LFFPCTLETDFSSSFTLDHLRSQTLIDQRTLPLFRVFVYALNTAIVSVSIQIICTVFNSFLKQTIGRTISFNNLIVVIVDKKANIVSMPLPYFNMQQPKLYYMDGIAQSMSTDSTVDVSPNKVHSVRITSAAQPQRQSPPMQNVVSLTNPFRKTSPTPPEGSWRTKDYGLASSVFRDERVVTRDDQQESLWTIQRCDAFDEESDSEE
jgi:hypothetical protein